METKSKIFKREAETLREAAKIIRRNARGLADEFRARVLETDAEAKDVAAIHEEHRLPNPILETEIACAGCARKILTYRRDSARYCQECERGGIVVKARPETPRYEASATLGDEGESLWPVNADGTWKGCENVAAYLEILEDKNK